MGDRIEQFLLSISPMGSGDRPDEKFLIRTEKVPKGAPLGQEEVVWPLDHWIDQAQLLSGDPLVAMLNPQDAATQTPSAFGSLLYDQVFQKSIRDSWLVSQGVAQNQKQVLQLRLGLKGDRLPRLPWESLSGDGRTLTTGTEVTFSRYRLKFGHQSSARDGIDQLRFHQRLRILMAVSEPDDRDRLELSKEVDQLKGELAKLQESDQPLDITIDVLEQPDRGRLTQALEQGKYQIFHYAGHSSSGPDGGNLHLVNSRTGLTERLSGQDLAGLLVNNGVLLAFFNSCQGSYTAAGAPSTALLAKDKAVIDNLAAALVERGVPGVLAMSENIPDEVALTLMQLFYRNLRPDYSVDLSLSRVRQGLVSAYGSNRFYWALPSLYLHPDFDGYLFKPAIATPVNGADLGWNVPLPEDDDDRLSADWDVAAEPVAQASGDRPDPLPPELAGQSGGIGGMPTLPPFSLKPSAQKPAKVAAKATSTAAKIAQTAPAATPAQGESKPDLWQERLPRGRRSVPWILGGLAIATFGAGGLLWGPGDQPSVSSGASPNPTSSPTSNPAATSSSPLPSLPKSSEPSSGEELATLGRQYITQDNRAGVWAVLQELLSSGRNDLAAAANVVAAMPTNWNSAEAFFWRGRLAWQASKQGREEIGSVEDATRYWSQAIAQNGESVVHQTALGFAYYQAKDFENAQIQWTKAIRLADQDSAEVPTPVAPQTEAQKQEGRSRLDAHAGLALISWEKEQAADSVDEKEKHHQAIQYHLNIVNSADGSNFTGSVLGNNWVWSQGALANWEDINAPQ
ncbi:MAG: CHAT domain-containing protein [Cyanobacteria bacterium P01_D01_bin.73]